MIEEASLPIERACKTFDISKRAYYKWKKREPPVEEDLSIIREMQNIAEEFPKYGYRRITAELRRRDMLVNHKRVHRLMKEHNLLVRRRRFKPVTTQSNHSYFVYPNLILDLEVTGLNHVWVADITYIRLIQEFVYLASIMDRYSRKCVGWDLSRNVDTELTLSALQMAIAGRKRLGFGALIHHSDQGVQYASTAYVELLQAHNIVISMSRRGNSYDNAFAESFFKTLKAEEVYMNEYETFEDAYANIRRFIEEVYNEKRLHSSIGYVPPNEFEEGVLKRGVS